MSPSGFLQPLDCSSGPLMVIPDSSLVFPDLRGPLGKGLCPLFAGSPALSVGTGKKQTLAKGLMNK